MEHTVELYGLDISRLLQSFINGKCAGLESSAPSCRSPHSSTKIVSVDESLNGEYTPSEFYYQAVHSQMQYLVDLELSLQSQSLSDS